jgi:PII-like signaling protein
VSEPAHKLTVYFGERDRAADGFLADRLIAIFERHRLAASALLRGVEGYGAKQALRSDRLLTLSEDLPLVAVAVDRPEPIEAALEEVRELRFGGLVTVERALLSLDPADAHGAHEELKLTAYLGRGRRQDGRPPYEQAVAILRAAGVAGATVLLGVDGTIAGGRRRARFFSANAGVPAMLISIGARERVVAALPQLAALSPEAVVTVERVRVLKRDGRRLADLEPVAARDGERRERWLKLTLFSSEANRFDAVPAHVAAIRALRAAGAPGATALRGVWGYHGEHEPHGDRFWSVTRRVPTVTIAVDRPEPARRCHEVLDRVSPARGLLTAEIVPAALMRGPEAQTRGELRLAERIS